MYIQCPACQANAQIPDSKEGAKVRCGECERVYVATPIGERGARTKSSQNTGLYIGLGVGGLALLMFLIISNSGDEPQEAKPTVKAVAPVTTELVNELGWDSEVVKVVRRIHQAAFEGDDGTLLSLLDSAHIHATQLQQAAVAAEETPPELAAGISAFAVLSASARAAVQRDAIDSMLTGADKELIASWKPYDGSVADLRDSYALVHVSVTPTDGGTEKRTVEWELFRDGKRWKAFRWARWFSDAEKKSSRKRRSKGYEKVTLSDGSKVFEREAEALPYLDETPAEMRTEIDGLYRNLIDEEPRVYTTARKRLTEIGKPAVPRLLTGLYEIPLTTEAQAIQVNAIVVTLRDITGQNFAFRPLALVGSSMGTSEERRQSAIKQWFAWWYRDGDKFEEKITTDALDDLIKLSDKDKAWLERNKN